MRVKKLYVVFCVLILLVPYLTYIPNRDTVKAAETLGSWEYVGDIPTIFSDVPNYKNTFPVGNDKFITYINGIFYEYDANTNTWTNISSVHPTLYSLLINKTAEEENAREPTIETILPMSNGNWYVAWYRTEGKYKFYPHAIEYNPITKVIVRQRSYPYTWSGAYLNGYPILDEIYEADYEVLKDGRFIAVGGEIKYDNYDTSANKVNIYDPITDRWNRGANFPEHRLSGSAVTQILSDGRVIVVAGDADEDNSSFSHISEMFSRNTWIYDPIDYSFSVMQDAPLDIADFGLAGLKNGTVMLTLARDWPGWNEYKLLNETWRFDPTTNQWDRSGFLPPPVNFYIVDFQETLNDGRILVWGRSLGSSNYKIYIFDQNAKPTVTNVTPAGNYTTNNRTVNVSWLFNDPDIGDTQGKYQVVGSLDHWATWGFNSGEIAGTASSYSATVTADGQWNFAVRVADQKGKWSDWTYINNITIDSTAPTIAGVTTPLYAKENFNVDITGVSDPGSGIQKVGVWARYTGSSTWKEYATTDLGGGNYRATIEPATYHGNAEGSYEIQVRAYDNAGNVNDYYVTNPKYTMYDLTPPKYTGTVTVDSVVDQGAGSYRITISGISDALSGMDTVRFPTWTTNNGQDDLVWHVGTDLTGGKWQVDIPFSQHNNETGTYTTHIYAKDNAGNEVMVAAVNVEVQTSYNAQVVGHTIPDEISPNQTVDVQVTMKNTGFRPWTARDQIKLGAVGDSDPFSTIGNRILIPDGVQVNPGQEYTFTIPMKGPDILGEYTTDWRMVKEGVTWFGETLSKTVGVKNNIPTLTVTSPLTMVAYTTSPSNKFTVEGLVKDLDNDDVTVSVEVGGTTKSTVVTNTANESAFSIEFDAVTDYIAAGEYPINITIMDAKGGMVSDSEHKVTIKQRLDNGIYLLVNTFFDSYPKRIYTDPEDDPMLKEQFRFEHNPSYFTNNTGSSINVDYIDIPTPDFMPYTSFSEVGQYKLFARAMDNPKDDYNFAEFRLWSDDTPNYYTFYVHRKPIAEFTLQVNSASGGYTVSFTDTSYDLDHMNLANKGIVNREWKYRKKGDILWISGKPTGTLVSGGEYEVGLRVQDQDGPNGLGVWSDWSIQTFKAVDSPIAGFTIDPIEAPRGKTFTITSTAVEPNGLPLTYTYKIEDLYGGPVAAHTQSSIVNGDFTMTFSALQQLGKPRDTYKITQTVKNSAGITATASKTFAVVNQKPNVTNGKVAGLALSSTNSNPVSIMNKIPSFSWVYNDADYDKETSYRIRVFDKDGYLMQSSGIKNTTGITSGTAQSWSMTNAMEDGTYIVMIEVHDGYEWSDIYKGYFSINTNKAPIAGFTIQPNPIFEGDTVTIKSTATDPDGDILTYQYWIQTPGSSSWTPISTNKNWSKVCTTLGTYDVKQRVTDPSGLWDEVTKSFTVENLTVTGNVLHTDDWNKTRLKWNAKYDPDRPYDMFWAGEKFLLSATTTNTGDSLTKASEVQVSAYLGVTSINQVLSTNDFLHWNGQAWKDVFEDIPDGTYTFSFTAVWKNQGVVTHTETNSVDIQIKDSYLVPLQLHRIK